MATVIYRSSATKKILIAMVDLFNEIKVQKRIDKNSDDFEDVIIPVYLGSTEKLITRLSGEYGIKQHLPSIGIQVTSMDFDEGRHMSPIHKIMNDDKGQFVFNPVPYNYTIDVHLIAAKESQLFELIEQIVPLYQKARYYPLVEFKFNDGDTIQRDLAVELTSTPISLSDVDIGKEDQQVFEATLSFIVKGWVYGSNSSIVYANSTEAGQSVVELSKAADGNNVAGGAAGSGMDGSVKLIEYIDINFETWNEAIYENMLITEDTTEDIVSTIT